MGEDNKWMRLVKSRRFWLAVFGVVQTAVSLALKLPDALWVTINALVGVMITVLTVDDTQAAQRAHERELDEAYRQWTELKRAQGK